MPRAKVETKRVALYLTVEAIQLLEHLAPSENKRGQYVSKLVREAAERAGLVEASDPATADLVELQRQLQDLQARVNTALAQQQGKPDDSQNL